MSHNVHSSCFAHRLLQLVLSHPLMYTQRSTQSQGHARAVTHLLLFFPSWPVAAPQASSTAPTGASTAYQAT